MVTGIYPQNSSPTFSFLQDSSESDSESELGKLTTHEIQRKVLIKQHKAAVEHKKTAKVSSTDLQFLKYISRHSSHFVRKTMFRYILN